MRIDVTDLSYSIGAQTILDSISLSIEDGSRAAIVGPSGSGKSSLIRMIAGLASPSGGTVSLGGRVVTGTRNVPAHRRGVAYVPQDGALFPHSARRRTSPSVCPEHSGTRHTSGRRSSPWTRRSSRATHMSCRGGSSSA